MKNLLVALLLCTLSSFTASSQAFDNFDSYANGAGMDGVNGWAGWDNMPMYAGGTVSNIQSQSAPHSFEIEGMDDMVWEFSGYTSGTWAITADIYIPGNFAGITSFILLNTYIPGGPYNWSTQLSFVSSTGLVTSDPENVTRPIITDQWVQIRVVIDLDLDQQRIYYDGQLLSQKSWTEGQSGGGAVNIGALDLYSDDVIGSTPVYYDNISLQLPSCNATFFHYDQGCGQDDASNPPYADGWQTGDNGGCGFGPWSLTTTAGGPGNGGHFRGSSTANGDGDSNGDDDIDSAPGFAWGMYANDGNVSEAIRPFDQPMIPGKSFGVDLDNGWIEAGGMVAMALQNAGGENLWEFFFIGGSADYTIFDASGMIFTAIPFTDEGLSLSFQLTGPGAYMVDILGIESGILHPFSGNLIPPASGDLQITQAAFVNANAGFDSPRDFFLNSLTLGTPVPGCPPDVTVSALPGQCHAAVQLDCVVAEDPCGITSLEFRHRINDGINPPGPWLGPNTIPNIILAVGRWEIQWVATNCDGCVTTCSYFVSVHDSENPVISCPANITIECGESLDTSNTGQASAIDNCPGEITITYNTTYNPNTGCVWQNGANTIYGVSGTGTYTRQWIATDDAGNADTCYQTIFVRDSKKPYLDRGSIPSTIDTFCTMLDYQLNGLLPTVAQWIAAGGVAFDTCADGSDALDPSSWTWSSQAISQNPTVVRTTYRVQDSCGNFQTAWVDAVIGDFEDPVALCQDINVFLDAGLEAEVEAGNIDNGSSDDCAIDTLFLDRSQFNCSDLGTHTVVLTAEDEGGNTDTCHAIVRIMNDPNQPLCCLDGESDNHFIASLSEYMSGQINPSGDDGGFGDYTGIYFAPPSPYYPYLYFFFTPGGTPSLQNWELYIDWNDNDLFEASEKMMDYCTMGPFMQAINVAGRPNGLHRMRLIMQADTDNDGCQPGELPVDLCGPIGEGEVEDYTVLIGGSPMQIQIQTQSQIQVFPNPFKDEFLVSISGTGFESRRFGRDTDILAESGSSVVEVEFEIVSSQGQIIMSGREIYDGDPIRIEGSQLTPGTYFLRVNTGDEVMVKTVVKR